MNIEACAAALGRYDRKAGGGFMACCPAHDDKNPSLSLDTSDTGLLFHCFAGCSQTDVIEALKARGLWSDPDEFCSPRKAETRQEWKSITPVPVDTPEPPSTHPRYGSPSQVWHYRMGNGELLQLVYRFDTENGKQVLPLTYCTNGTRSQWRWQALPKPRPLYGLETLADIDRVVLTEGEKDADAARRLLGPDFPVLTWSGGSNAVSKSDWSPLSGKEVYLWRDADIPGIKAAFSLCTELENMDCTLGIIEPPDGVEQGWGAADAEDCGWTKDQTLDLIKGSLPPQEFQAKYRPALEEKLQTETLTPHIEDGTEWEEPMLFGHLDTPEIKADALPGWLGEYTAAVAKNTQTPPGMAVMLALSTVATCLQGKVVVSPRGDDYHEPVNLWTVTALPPASRKTAVISAITKPLSDWEQYQAERLADQIERTQDRRKVNLARIDKLTKQAANQDDPQQRDTLLYEIERTKNETPEEIKAPRLWTGDVTPERLQGLLMEHGERMALLSDEGGIFEIMAGLYNDGRVNLDVFLQAHAGKSVRVDRSSRLSHLEAPTLTFGLAVQPSVIADLSMGSKRKFRGNGALARFLFCLPENNIGRRDVRRYEPIPEHKKTRYQAGITGLLDMPLNKDTEGKPAPRVLCLDSAALDSLLTFADFIERNQGVGGELEPIQDWTGKLPGAALRIAGLFHIVEHGATNDTINQSTMEAALDLAKLLITHAKAAFDLMGADQVTDDAQAVLRWIQRQRQETFTRRDCHNALQGRFKKVDRLQSALNVLQQRSIISKPEKIATGRRPSIAFRVNPAVFTVSNS